MQVNQLLAGAALAAGLALATAAQASIVLDGDFSSPSGGASYVTYAGGSNMGPWTVTGGSVDLIGGYWQNPTAGGGSVDLDGLAPGGVTQSLSLAPGVYVLTFDLSGNPDGAPAAKSVDVSVGDVTNQNYTYTIGANSRLAMDYVTETLRFTATGPTTLSFVSQDVSTPYGPVIGGVDITAVPEPATWAMMLIGFAAIGFGVRLRGPRTALAA